MPGAEKSENADAVFRRTVQIKRIFNLLNNNYKQQIMKIKLSFKSAPVMAVALFSGAVLFTSCEKEKKEETPNTITNIVSGNPQYSMLKSAVVKANLAETLNGSGPFTVFAPDNDAFAASGITSSAVNGMSASDLKDILLYHTLGSKVVAADVPTGPNAEVETVGGKKVYVTKNSMGVFINGWKVTKADIMASNGVIHAIEHVLMPPTQSLVEMAQNNDNLTYLVAAVLRANEGDTKVIDVLSGDGPFTVFAPVNQAFMDAGFPTIASIQAADPNTLASILTYHVLAGRAFSSDLSDGASLKTVSGGTIAVDMKNGAMLKGKSNTSASKITAVNMLATNGVVHVIDQVLLP